MGLDVYLKAGPHDEDDCNAPKVELPSASYPEHYFKIGYFRSSYNGSGFNNAMRQYGLSTLDDICEPSDAYGFTPDWSMMIDRAAAALIAFDAAHERMRYRVHTETFIDSVATSEEQALAVFLAEMGKNRAFDDGGWSSRRGTFIPKGMKVCGLMQGTRFGPCLYVVVEQEPEAIGWYRNAIEIVRETAEWVLAQPDPKAFHLHWSS